MGWNSLISDFPYILFFFFFFGVKALRNSDRTISCYLNSPLVRSECRAFRRNLQARHSYQAGVNRAGDNSCLRFHDPRDPRQGVVAREGLIVHWTIQTYKKQNILVTTKNHLIVTQMSCFILSNIWISRSIWKIDSIPFLNFFLMRTYVLKLAAVLSPS